METSDKENGNISLGCMSVCFAGVDVFEAVASVLTISDRTPASSHSNLFLFYHGLPYRCATARLKCSSG